MKNYISILLLTSACITKSFSQNITPSDIVGTWDQNISSRAATIIFDDVSRVRFSYKGHTGSTRKYYYLLNNTQTPAILTVDYRANHRRHRNEYLIQLTDKNTMKLQVLRKNDSRQHFDEEHNDKIITLIRRLDL
ncbi:MAG TPA: hypothetical protein VMT76_10720 [Puia sp.]|nr:hypothetical protein [Puia sp.]